MSTEQNETLSFRKVEAGLDHKDPEQTGLFPTRCYLFVDRVPQPAPCIFAGLNPALYCLEQG